MVGEIETLESCGGVESQVEERVAVSVNATVGPGAAVEEVAAGPAIHIVVVRITVKGIATAAATDVIVGCSPMKLVAGVPA